MKKNLQTLIALAFAGSSFTAIAQPSLTGANMNATVGEVFSVGNNSVQGNPGSSGANQTWNFSSWTAASTSNYTAMTVASTPSGSSFSGANIAFSDGNVYSYYNNSASSSQNYGSVAQSVVFSYSNPETIMTFPFNFNSTSTDSWSCVYSVPGPTTFTRTGTTTTTADAWGTVTTPAGAFSNSMRIHLVQTYTDVSASFTFTSNNDEYIWYQPGKHYAVAATYTFVNSFSGTSYQTFYLNSSPTGIHSYEPFANNLNVFPNPASHELNLNFDSRQSSIAELNVCDVTGKAINTVADVDIRQGHNSSKINTSQLPNGVYFISIKVDGVLQRKEKFIVAH